MLVYNEKSMGGQLPQWYEQVVIHSYRSLSKKKLITLTGLQISSKTKSKLVH